MPLNYLAETPPVTDALRADVVEDLPEINDIADAALRAKVVEAWATALAGSSFGRVSDIPGAGNPNDFVLKRDVVLAGALCHDVGKAWEFDPVNQTRWADDPYRAGQPSLRHSVFGVHICLSVGLPEEIAHIALGHSMEGQHIGLSTECTIVRHADHTWWLVACSLGLLQPDTIAHAGPTMRPRRLAGEPQAA